MKKAILAVGVAVAMLALARPVQATPITDLWLDDLTGTLVVSVGSVPGRTLIPVAFPETYQQTFAFMAPMYVTGPADQASWRFNVRDYPGGPMSDTLDINWDPTGYQNTYPLFTIVFKSVSSSGPPSPLEPPPPVVELFKSDPQDWILIETGISSDALDHLNIHFRMDPPPTYPNQIPDGGSALALLGFSLMGLESVRRKLNR